MTSLTNAELAALNRSRRIHQIAWVTRDLDATMRAWVDNLQIGPWMVFTFSEETVRNLQVGGEPVTEPFKFLIAISSVGDMEIEIIQPVYGPTIYEAFIEKHGEGLHHIKERIHDDRIAAVLAEYRARGIGVTQTGWFERDVHHYLDTEPKLNFIYELGNCPVQDLPPHLVRVFPPEP
jgi:methylmalonyl-CoA/ethylmalonyl-CoA epimerase